MKIRFRDHLDNPLVPSPSRCGHCQKLAPEWKSTAEQLKGKVKVGAVDATVHTSLAADYNIQAYPTVKYFPGGVKSSSPDQDYDGGRTAADFVAWATDKYVVNLPAPEIYQLTSEGVARTACERQPLCIVSILPNIYDCNADCRKSYLKILGELADKYKQRQWGWLWAEGGSQPAVEEALDIGGNTLNFLKHAMNQTSLNYCIFRLWISGTRGC